MTKYPDLFSALAAPFDDREVKTLEKRSGLTISYITARTAMNRLDEVLGPEGWWDQYFPGPHSVACSLTIRLPDGSTLTKQDVGGYPGMTLKTRSGDMVRDDENDEKAGWSDAFKRAAAKFGVARYLYRDGIPAFVTERPAPEPTPSPAPGRARRQAGPQLPAGHGPGHRPLGRDRGQGKC